MSEHSNTVGGSSADRVINCPASIKMGAAMPSQPTSSYAAEGTMCHAVMEASLLNDMTAPSEDLIGTVLLGVEITRDIYFQKLIPAWEATLEAFKRFSICEFEAEGKVEFKSVPNAFGTCDIFAKGRDDLVVILDYKFGAGHMVSPVENKQLMFYAAAAIEDGAFDEWFDGHPNQPVVLGIIQPTDEQVLKTWETTAGALRIFTGLLGMAVSIGDGGQSEPNEGDWCKYCPALPVCPAHTSLAREAEEFMDAVTSDALTDVLELAFKLEPWIKSVKKLAHEQLERGDKVEGWKLVKKRALRKWVDLEGVNKKLRNAKKITRDAYLKETLLTPPQLEKVFKAKGLDFDVLNEYIEAVSSGTTLAPADDKREGIVRAGKRDIPEGLAEKMK